MPFFKESVPERAAPVEVAPGIRRVVADNPSKMTYHGTNSYLVDTPEGIFVIDPGPVEDEGHFAALLELLEKKPGGIIVSHHHSDHFGAVPRLKATTGLNVYASEVFADDTFRPDIALVEGDEVAGLKVLHTPGHASDHLCFRRSDGVLFTGDHIMTWSSSMIKIPDGDMQAYCQQLERLLGQDDNLYLPGHGPPLADPLPYTQQLLDHRERRDLAILEKIRQIPSSTKELATTLYRKADVHLAWAAERNVEAHLDKLEREGRAKRSDEIWTAV